ncbi:MAG: Bug family tripartite tricarboxylate transporter substrate binding protein [Chloroflexota bacterium]
MKLIVFLLVSFTAWTVQAHAQTPFYQGKTIRFIVGYPAGSTHDLWARLVGPYMTKYIPGNPNIIVQNMPGAGSATAANYVYGVAKPDGLSIAVVNAALYFDQLLGRKEVHYDWAKFGWIGSTTRSDALLYMWGAAPYKTIQDVRAATTPPKCGTTGTGNTGYFLPKLLEETIGAKFTIVAGYQGGAEIELAAERGEVQCRAISIPVYFGREPFLMWQKKGLARILIQTGKKRDSRLRDVPTLYELMDQYKTPAPQRRLAGVMLSAGGFGLWPAMTSPNTPEEHIRTLRAAFTKALNSSELLTEAKQKNMEVELISGDDLAALAKEVVVQPPEIIEQMKKLMGS